MKMKAKIKLLTLLMGISNLLTFASIDYKQPIGGQLLIFIPIVFAMFVILYFFYKGKNWARILVIIGSVLTLLLFLTIFNSKNIIETFDYIYSGILSLYLLIFLNTVAAKEYFKKPVSDSGQKKSGKKRFSEIS